MLADYAALIEDARVWVIADGTSLIAMIVVVAAPTTSSSRPSLSHRRPRAAVTVGACWSAPSGTPSNSGSPRSA